MWVYHVSPNKGSSISQLGTETGLVEMATTGLPMTTSSFGYNTTVNSTWPAYSGNRSRQTYERDPNKIREIQARFITIIIFSIPTNLGIIAIILGNKNLRTQAFFLGVLSISIFDLCNGMFVLPMGMEHQLHWDNWRHGDIVCMAFQVISISKTFLSALMNIVLCIERLLAKLKSVAAISEKMASTASWVLIILPWCIGSLLCAPLVVLNRKDLSHHFAHDQYCVFVLEQASHIPTIVVLFLVPLGLLVLVTIATMLVYKYMKLHWTRLSAEALEPEAVSLYMSTLCVWIVSLVYVAMYVPMTVVITLFVMCARGMTDCPNVDIYENSYTLSLLPSVVTPFLWIITVEIRTVLSSLKAWMIRMVAPTDGRESVLTFSSLRNKMSSDDTDVLS